MATSEITAAVTNGTHAPSKNFGRPARKKVASRAANATANGILKAGLQRKTRVATTKNTMSVASIVADTARPNIAARRALL